MIRLLHGDCVEELKALPDASIDAVVTDPPYGLGFMGEEWDSFVAAPRKDGGSGLQAPFANRGRTSSSLRNTMPEFQAAMAAWAQEAWRVLKPGGHLLSFGGTRTYHRMACAIEDVGFEIRDSIHWMYGSGFPKSMNVGKAIDATLLTGGSNSRRIKQAIEARPGDKRKGAILPNNGIMSDEKRGTGYTNDNPATAQGATWNGWGTALKPSHEPIVVARKPLDGTVAANVLAHGTGALNIDGCRVATTDTVSNHSRCAEAAVSKGIYGDSAAQSTHQTDGQKLGRWPPNTIFSHLPECGDTCAEGCAVAELDAQSGTLKSGAPGMRRKPHETGSMSGRLGLTGNQEAGYGDTGGASRFFPAFRYHAKPAPKERKVEGTDARHPTQKPAELMRWLVRLVTPPGGVVLDPFMGSGTTGVACLLEGFRFVGVEQSAEFFEMSQKRLEALRLALTEGAK